jgi:hypothetical protein
MILAPFDTIKMSTHMSVIDSSRVHMSETTKKAQLGESLLVKRTSSSRRCPPLTQL